MTSKRWTALLATVGVAVAGGSAALAVGATADQSPDERSAALSAAIDGRTPKNVILMIGDGMGASEITAARAYQGADTPLNMDRLPFSGQMTTHALGWAQWGSKYEHVTDSAGAATAMFTGQKTMPYRLSQAATEDLAKPGADLETMMERAKKLGKRVGNVTTVDIYDATPAAQLAHINDRECFTPQKSTGSHDCSAAMKKNGGKGSILEQMIDAKADLVVGSGRGEMEAGRVDLPGSEWDGMALPAYAEKRHGTRYITQKDDFLDVESLKDGNVWALFGTWDPARSSHPRELRGPGGALGADGLKDQECRPAEDYPSAEVPRIDESTGKALELLSEDNDKGFFLQVEGGAIDDEAHSRLACGVIGETLAFDRAVGVAMEYQRTHPDTLLVVTTDHSQAGLIVPAQGPQVSYEAGAGSDNTKLQASQVPAGPTVTLRTKDGSRLRLTYGTVSATGGSSQKHTGAQVPVFAVGPQAANIQGTIDNTDLFPLLSFGLQSSVAPPQPTPTTTVTVPGPATTVPGPTREVPVPVDRDRPVPGPERVVERAPAPAVGVAAPSSLRLADARRGLPVSVVGTRAGKARVRVVQGGRTVFARTVDVAAGKATQVRLVARKVAAGKARVAVTLTAGSARATGSASVTLRRR